MASLWTRGGLSARELLKRLWGQVFEDELLGRAAELAYFFLFSIFPLLLFLTTLLGYLASTQELRDELFVFVSRVSPSPDVTRLMRDTLREVTEGKSGGKLSVGLVIAVWLASNGMLAIGRALNTACGLEETRRWWWRRLVAIALTVVFAILTISALILLLYGSEIGAAVARSVGMGDLFEWVWQLLQWPIILLFMVFAFEVTYNFAPNLQSDERNWLTPGAVAALGLWLLVSFGFQVYVSYFGFYSRTYGSLGVVIVLLLWFYLAGLALLMGGEINSEIGKALREAREKTLAAETAETADSAEEPA